MQLLKRVQQMLPANLSLHLHFWKDWHWLPVSFSLLDTRNVCIAVLSENNKEKITDATKLEENANNRNQHNGIDNRKQEVDRFRLMFLFLSSKVHLLTPATPLV